MPSETEICFRRHFYNQTAGRLFEFVGVLQADDVGVVFETCGRRVFAGPKTKRRLSVVR